MTNTKTTKRALLASVLSIVICLTMLIGSTFAWFTDTASTGVNLIQSGNLDLVLEYRDADGNWVEVKNDTKLFKDGALWEPGYTEVAYIRVRNNGSLAFKYQLAVNVANEEKGTNVNGKEFALSQYIQFGVVESTTEISKYSTRENAWEAVEGNTTFLNTYNSEGVLLPKNGETAAGVTYLALVVYMPTTTGNDANHNGDDKPSIELGVTVNATQTPHESDSFGNDYDNVLFDNERRATNDSELATILNGDLTGVDTVYLNGSFGATTLPAGTNGIALVGQNGATMDSLNINGAKNVVIDGLTFDASKAANVFDNKAGSNNDTNFDASIYDYRWNGSNFGAGSEDITIKNCTFRGTATVAGETGYAAICINENGAGTRAKNYTVESCTFNCNAVSYVYFNYLTEGTAVIKNNTFGGTAYSTTYGNVGIVNSYTDAIISGNTFYNWDKDDSAIKASCPSGTTSENYSKYNVTNNTFNGAVEQKAVIEIRRCGTDHIVSGNNYSGVTGRTCIDTDTSTSSANVTVYFRG